jgi:hypothetical protein
MVWVESIGLACGFFLTFSLLLGEIGALRALPIPPIPGGGIHDTASVAARMLRDVDEFGRVHGQGSPRKFVNRHMTFFR